MKRTLTLRRETLTELGTDDLTRIVGGGSLTYTILPSGCKCTGWNPSLNAPCPTLDCTSPVGP